MAGRSAKEITDPYLSAFTSVPSAGPGVCEICHGAPGPGFATCYSCHQTTQQVSSPASLVVPISLCERRGQLHYVLRMYKDGNAQLQERFRPVVAATLAQFIARHRSCIADAGGGDWSTITTVPSSRGRQGTHPLALAVQMIVGLADEYEPLLRAGPTPATHNQANDAAYEVVRDVRGTRVLLIDDTFTTGASVQSAASALSRAGALVVGIVAIGRYVVPEYNEQNQELWESARQAGFSFDVCCLEGAGEPPTSAATPDPSSTKAAPTAASGTHGARG